MNESTNSLECFYFIVHRSYFIVFFIVLVRSATDIPWN
jgi:hypothetical protein